MSEQDEQFLRIAFVVACDARNKGNHPFGAVLVDDKGRIILEGENTVVSGKDCTGHAETNLVRKASALYDRDFLARCTLYASTEPCPMCSGAIFWANIRRVVYGLSEEGLYALVGRQSQEVLALGCREVLARGKKPVEVIGPLLEQEAREAHLGFWSPGQ